MELWTGVAIAGVVGFGLGALVVWWIDRKRGGGTSVASLKQEHEQFREQVTTHFVETADLINRLTDSYKDVFDHLSKGAETLVDDKSLRDRMPRVSDQEVRLKRIGARSSEASTKAPTEASKSSGGSRAASSGDAPDASSQPSSRQTSDRSSGPDAPKSGRSSGNDAASRDRTSSAASTKSGSASASGSAATDGSKSTEGSGASKASSKGSERGSSKR